VQPIIAKLQEDRSDALRRRAGALAPKDDRSTDSSHQRAASPLEQGLPAAVEEAKALLLAEGPTAPVGVLHGLIDLLRGREAGERAGRAREWSVVRAAVHQLLAARGSRIGLYDLRETLESAGGPVAVGFLAAAGVVGDASCLEALGACYARSAAGRDDAWRRQLATAFREIVRREKITRRHAALRRMASKWPGMVEEILR
jgi:hypothetical protein